MNTVATFTVQYYQFLDENGKTTDSLPVFTENSDLLISLYRNIKLLRLFDARALALQRTGKMGTYALSLGQEALPSAVGLALHKDDVFCPYYRDQGVLYQRGVRLSELLAFWGGDERGSNFSENTEDFPIAIPVASQYLHAVGIGYAMKLRKQKRAVAVSVGDGGTSRGDFYEALNAAGLWDLPVVFLVNNNQWAISVSREKQSGTETIAQKAIAGGVPGIQVDGNDPIALYHVISSAVEKARNGEGPTLIESLTYRLCDHTTADDAKRYVNPEELAEAEKKEPLIRFEKFLKERGILKPEQEESIRQEILAEVDKAWEEYSNRTPENPEAIMDYLYETLPEPLQEQRDQIKGGVNV